MVKNLPDNTGDIRDPGSISELGRSPGGGSGNPLQYSCLENPMDREDWRAMPPPQRSECHGPLCQGFMDNHSQPLPFASPAQEW